MANGVTTVFSFDLDSNEDNAYDNVGGYVLHEVYEFYYESNNRNEDLPVVTYTGPGIDYSKKHNWEN